MNNNVIVSNAIMETLEILYTNEQRFQDQIRRTANNYNLCFILAKHIHDDQIQKGIKCQHLSTPNA